MMFKDQGQKNSFEIIADSQAYIDYTSVLYIMVSLDE